MVEAIEPKALGPGPFCELDENTRSRCTICAGAVAVRLILALKSGSGWELEERAKQTIEQLFKSGRFLIWGESAVPFFLAAMWALDETRGDQFADRILLSLLSAVTRTSSSRALLSPPYESADEALAKGFRQAFEGAEAMDLQAAASYTLAPLVTIAVRRLWRNQLAGIWSLITKIDCVELVPDMPRDLLLWHWEHARGSEQARRFAAPQSWAELLRDSRNDEDNALPGVLKSHFDFELLFLLTYPQRVVRSLVKHLEVAVCRR